MYVKHRALRSQTIVDGALQLFDSPEKWTQEYEALDHQNNRTEGYSPTAVCWCLDGAFQCIAYQEGFLNTDEEENELDLNDIEEFSNAWATIYNELNRLLKIFLPRGSTYIEFNDHPHTTFEEVIQVLKAGSEAQL